MPVHFYSVMCIRASLRVSELLVSRRLCTWRQMPFPTCRRTRKGQQEVEEWWCERTSCRFEGLHTIGLCISRFPSETMHAKRTWNDGMKTLRQIFQRYLALKSEFGRMGQREVLSKSVRFMIEDFARQNKRTYTSQYLGEARGNVDNYLFKETRRTGFRSRCRRVHAHDELFKEYWFRRIMDSKVQNTQRLC